MNSTCFQDAIGLIQISISPGYLRLLNKMDKDLLHKIFVPLRGIKQEVYHRAECPLFSGHLVAVHEIS